MSAIATPMPSVPRAAAVEHQVTPDDLLAMEDGGLYELVDGRLVGKQMASESNWIAGRIAFFLTGRSVTSGVGEVLPEQTFQCFPEDPDATRRPDVAFVVAAKVPTPWPPGHLRFPPDLAVEVVSPNDNLFEVERELADYRSAGVPVVWVVVPNVRLIRVHPLAGPVVELRDGDTLRGEPLLPGFAVAVTDVFPRRAVPTAA